MKAAQQIESYLLSGTMPESIRPEDNGFCEQHIRTEGKETIPAVKAAGEIYTREEAAAEAGRCLQCDCSECMETCEMLQKYRKDPIRVTTEIYQDAVVVAGASMRTIGREVSSCNLCGLCKGYVLKMWMWARPCSTPGGTGFRWASCRLFFTITGCGR